MNALPVTIDPRAAEDVRGLPPELRPAVFEHLSRIGADHASCSRPTAIPHPPGLESGLWLRYADGRATLLEVLFFLTTDPEGVTVRRVLTRAVDRLPDWVIRPGEWSAHPPWPVVDL